MQKSVDDLITIIKEICPSIKASESLFIVDLIIEERNKEYYRGANRALDVREEELQVAKEEKEHYLDQPDYSAIKEDFDNREDDQC